MQFTYVVCNETEIMDRQTREVLGRIRQPRWYGDFWSASLAGGTVEEPTQSQLRVAIQKRLDRLADPADPLGPRRELNDLADPEQPPRPRRPLPKKPDHVKPTSSRPTVPPPLARPVNYAMTRRVRVFAQRAAASPGASGPARDPDTSRVSK